MRVVAICGSLKSDSTTRMALTAALGAAAAAGADTAFIPIAQLPFCDGRDGHGAEYGDAVVAFRAAVRAADAVLVGSPEYHGSFTGVLKNALDLLGPDELGGKMIGLIATANGDAGAMNTLNHLRHVARWVNAWVLPAQVSIPRAREAFGADGAVVRAGLDAELHELGVEVVRYARLLATDAR